MNLQSKGKLRAELSRDESREKFPYKDSEGIWSIAVGRNLEANPLPLHIVIRLLKAVGLEDFEIDELLDADIAEAAKALDALLPEWTQLDDDRQRVLLNMAFNLGQTRLGGFKKFLAALRGAIHATTDAARAAGFREAKAQMRDSKWHGQVGPRADRLEARMGGTAGPDAPGEG